MPVCFPCQFYLTIHIVFLGLSIVHNSHSPANYPTLNPWTVKAFIIGIGLSAFGGVLGTFLYVTLYLFFWPFFAER